jgi:hypothetical protein
LSRIEPIVDPANPEPLAEQVAQSVNTERLAEQASRVGDEIVLAENKFESRVEGKFSHDLGTLKDTHREGAYEQRTYENLVAGRLASLLTNPEGIREAMILSEILNRPVDRW